MPQQQIMSPLPANSTVLFFGFGYTARYVAAELIQKYSKNIHKLYATSRNPNGLYEEIISNGLLGGISGGVRVVGQEFTPEESSRGLPKESLLVEYEATRMVKLISQETGGESDHPVELEIVDFGDSDDNGKLMKKIMLGSSEKLNIIVSAPPSGYPNPDPVIKRHFNENSRATFQTVLDEFPGKKIASVIYLSTTGVYGNQNGELVTEEHMDVEKLSIAEITENPWDLSNRQRNRLLAEREWFDLCVNKDMFPFSVPLRILRLSGIYGPGKRNSLSQLAATERLIDKPGHFFNRIHVEDIARVVIGCMVERNSGESSAVKPVDVYNLADDSPSSSKEVLEFAYELLKGKNPEDENIRLPPTVKFEDALDSMSPMLKEFYANTKRVSNAKVTKRFGVLKYPGYREGLRDMVEKGRWEEGGRKGGKVKEGGVVEGKVESEKIGEVVGAEKKGDGGTVVGAVQGASL